MTTPALAATPWSRALGLEVPIVNAPMGGAAGGALAAAVSAAGGLGMIGVGGGGSVELIIREVGDPPSSGSPFRDRAPRLGRRARTSAPRCCRRCRTAARVGQLRLSGLVDRAASRRRHPGRDPGVRRRHCAASRGGRRRRSRGPRQRRRRPRTQRRRHPSPAPGRARRCNRPGSGCRGDRIFERARSGSGGGGRRCLAGHAVSGMPGVAAFSESTSPRARRRRERHDLHAGLRRSATATPGRPSSANGC